jgi:hypothetical protein
MAVYAAIRIRDQDRAIRILNGCGNGLIGWVLKAYVDAGYDCHDTQFVGVPVKKDAKSWLAKSVRDIGHTLSPTHTQFNHALGIHVNYALGI